MSTPTTSTPAHTPRAFIENIDTANEEIVRLDAKIAELTTEHATAVSAKQTAETALGTEQTAHKATQDKLATAETALGTEQTAHKATQDKLATASKELASKQNDSVHAAAAAGAAPIPTGAPATGLAQDDKKVSGYGLQRAISANIAAQKK